MPSIGLENVSKVHATGQAAVRDLTLDVEAGELLAIVGPSGSGKSTVLRLIAGLDAPTSGRVTIDGHDVTAVPPQQRDVAMVFQSYALYPHMTVSQNLAFGLKMRGVPRGEAAERVQRTAAMLGIGDLLDRTPAQLSGGQRQRVALGRALARNASVYLLDEPLSNLDPQLRVETRTELGLLQRRLGATMLYVTHDQEEAMTLGTRIVVMRAGALEQVGPPLDLYRRPANRFVAGFIGTPAINLVPGRCERVDGRWELASPLFGRLPMPDAPAMDASAAVEVGIRPHDIEVCPEPDAHTSGRIELVEPLGPALLLHVRIDALSDRLLRVLAPADLPVTREGPVHLRFATARLHLFDAGSGRRVIA